jgi:hypothetical protein
MAVGITRLSDGAREMVSMRWGFAGKHDVSLMRLRLVLLPAGRLSDDRLLDAHYLAVWLQSVAETLASIVQPWSGNSLTMRTGSPKRLRALM